MQYEEEKYNQIKADRFKNMTPSQKLNLSLNLNLSARELKKASLRQFHPELTEKEIEAQVREIFLYART